MESYLSSSITQTTGIPHTLSIIGDDIEITTYSITAGALHFLSSPLTKHFSPSTSS